MKHKILIIFLGFTTSISQFGCSDTPKEKNTEPQPQTAEEYLNLGETCYDEGRYEEAIEAYKESVRLQPDSAMAHNNLGASYRKLDRHQEAIEAFKEAIRIQPDHAKAYIGLGNIYSQLGRLQEGIEAYKEGIRIQPDYWALYNMSMNYGDLDRHAEAIEALKECVGIEPNFAEGHHFLGYQYIKVGDRESALVEYEILKNLDEKLANDLFNSIKK